jgi:hypothetical protein
MAEEKVLISIELEKGENEKEIDQLTRKITDLQTATANLQKQNNELIKSGKQNSQEYVENTRQIEINKQKIGEAISTRKGMIQTLIAEDNSIKALRIRNAELIKQRDQISTATETGRIKIAQLNAEIDRNNETIKANVSAQEKQRLGVGGYTEALDKLVPGLGATVNGIKATTQAALAFIATPLGAVLGAIGLAIAAVTAYFKGSEEGQNRWNKIVAVGSAILEQFMNVMEDVGEVIVDAFENPKQAAKDFLAFLESQFVNRITGMLNLIPSLGKAVEQLFKGNFAEAGKIAGDAVGQVVLGITNATDKIQGLISETARMVEQGIAFGERIAALNAQIDKDERNLIVSRAQTALEVSKLREEALKFEGDARKKVLLEAIALEEQLASRETELAKNRLALAKTNLEANGDDKEALKEVAEARAAVFAAEATAFQNSLRFRREISAIDEASAKEQAKLLQEANEMLDKALEEELKRKEREREAIVALEELRLETEIARAASIEERVAKEIELEQYKAFALLENEQLLESERQLIIEKSQKAINDFIVKGNDEKNKKQLEADKKLATEKKKLRDAEVSGINASLDAAVGLAKEAFGENKAIAIAETVINTVRGIVRAIADYPFPYSLIVSALVGAIGTVQTAKIAGIKFAHGGMVRNISRYGGVLRGPTHARGGIPFSVKGNPGFEAEGGEAIINKKSTKMFRKELSMINQAGGGVAFGRGGMTYATGNVISGTQTRQASAQAESRTAVRDAVAQVMESMPPIIVTVEDINARANEVADQTIKANVI